VVTGIDACTALGPSLDATWRRLVAGQSAIARVTHLQIGDSPFRSAALSAFATEPPPLRTVKHAKYAGRAVTCALHALAGAVRSANAGDGVADPHRVALYGATGQSGLEVDEFFDALSASAVDDAGNHFARFGGRAARLVDPHFSLRTLANGGLALIAAEVGARGPSNNYVQNEMASAFALRAAAADLREDRADMAIVFGCDSLPHPSTWLAFAAQGLLSADAPDRALRPFDARRDGTVLGEAGAVIVLETWDHAARRGVPVMADLVDVRIAAGGPPFGRPDAAVLPALLASALPAHVRSGDMRPGEPQALLVARGFGSEADDAREARAIASGPLDATIITAVKGALGYVGAATGVLDAVLAVKALTAACVPAIARLETPDPAFDPAFISRLVRDRARDVPTLSRAATVVAGWSGEWAVTVVGRAVTPS
jgi:3-oxoacyl-(acyl-carrier-protein) synthase